MFCTCDRQTNERTNTAKLVSPLVHTHIFAEKNSATSISASRGNRVWEYWSRSQARKVSELQTTAHNQQFLFQKMAATYSQSNLYFTKSVASSTYWLDKSSGQHILSRFREAPHIGKKLQNLNLLTVWFHWSHRKLETRDYETAGG